ncbi:hypothetical protein ACDX78_05010 [Virgibacillus oceani]
MTSVKYYPILKWRSGEKQALKELPEGVKKEIAPIIEIVDDEEVTNVLDFVKELNGINKIYFDSSYIEEGGGVDYLESLISQAVLDGVTVLPVLTYDEFKSRSNNFLEVSSELLVKVTLPADFEGDSYETIFTSLESWNNNYDLKVSVLLDLGLVEDRNVANRQFSELKSVLNNYLRKTSFLNIVIGITSFPDDLSSIPSGGESFYKRYDIKIFKALFNSQEFNDFKEKLSYSDYGVTKFTDSEIDFSKLRYGILPKARYTITDSYWILKGQRDNETKEWIKNHPALAQTIYSSDYYYGEGFSPGDYDIMERALGHIKGNPQKKIGPGGNTNWVTNAVSHHVTVVVNELSKVFDLSELT